MIYQTNVIAPKMHYWLVRWRGETQIRSCSEYLMSDEKPIALVSKDTYYKLVNKARENGLSIVRMTSRQIKIYLSKIN